MKIKSLLSSLNLISYPNNVVSIGEGHDSTLFILSYLINSDET